MYFIIGRCSKHVRDGWKTEIENTFKPTKILLLNYSFVNYSKETETYLLISSFYYLNTEDRV